MAFVLAIALGCGGPCGRKASTRGHSAMPNENLPRELKPLPDPPELRIARQTLPGADALSVVTVRPRGEVRGEVRPTITFSRPVKSLESLERSANDSKGDRPAEIEPNLEGDWKWLGSASVELVPRGPVPYSTRFRVKVLKGLKALDGSELKEDYAFEFTTPRLELQDVSPVRGYRWIKPQQTFKLLFNQPVKESDLAASAAFEVEGERAPWRARVLARTSIAEERRKSEEEARKDGRLERPDSEERAVNQQTRYELAADRPFPLNKSVKLKISRSVHGEQGPLAMDRDESLEWKVYGPLEISGARMCLLGRDCPYGPLVIFTSNPVDIESLRQRLTISPHAEVDWERAQAVSPHEYYQSTELPHVNLPGAYRPGAQYSVALSAGAMDEFGQKTNRPFQDLVRTDDLHPALYTGGDHALIEAASGPRLPVELVNLKSLDVEIWKVTIPEVARLIDSALYRKERPLPRAADVRERSALGYALNEKRVHPIDLSKAFGGKRTGIALVALSSPELDRQRRPRTLAQVTDLAVHVKVAPAQSLAWVTRLSSGESVEGATVSAYDSAGKLLWTGKSDPDGFADVPGTVALGFKGGPRVYSWETPFLLIAAEKEGDVGVTADTWALGIEPYEFGLLQGWEGAQPAPEGLVFTDRGIYRPGDKVFIKGVARFRQVGKLKTPVDGTSLVLKVVDSRQQRVSEQRLSVTRYGTFNAEIEVPKGAATGQYWITASGEIAEGSLSFGGGFRVEEYRAPQFKVDVEADSGELLQGEKLIAHAFARYLFGGAMSNARARWSVHRQSTSFAPDPSNGFVFGQETWWWDDQRPEPSSGFFASGAGVFDPKGSLDIEAGVLETPGERPWIYTVEVEAQDVNRQTAAGRTELVVHPASYYAGLRAPTGFAQAGRELSLEAVVVNASGKRVEGQDVRLSIVRRTWKSVRKKDASGFLTVSEPVEEPVHTCELESAEQPVACRFKPSQAGFYIAHGTVQDERHRRHTSSIGVYVTGPGFVAWQRSDTDRIDLIPDKASYDVGDIAHLLIKSPYPEANALLTVEREGVLERRAIALKGSVVTVDIPIREEMVPNVYAGVVLMRPRVAQGGIETGDDPGRPNARVGWVNLPVEKKTKRLTVTVATDKPEYRPGEEVAVNVEVRDHAGKGTPCELTVYAVDESVLRLTGYRTPDPIAAIFPVQPISVRVGEPLIHLVRRRGFAEKGEAQGGGGGLSAESSGYRSNFKTTILFNPTLEASASGRAHLKFRLPDNLTAFRVMAVAVTSGDRFGSGHGTIKVNKPLLALPALPRFARVGDRFEAGVVIHSYGAGEGEATVEASARNARLVGPALKTVQLDPSAAQEVRFAFTVEKPGQATFRFQVRKEAEHDGVEATIPIELPVELDVVATYGDTSSQRVEGISAPAGVWPGMGGLEVTLASTALANFDQGIQQLIDYPYGCLEQQSSRLVPFVALREIAGKFAIALGGPTKQNTQAHQEINAILQRALADPLDLSHARDPDEVISATVSSIEKLQEPDGSFKYWSDSWCADSWASAYATLALARVHQVGYAVQAEKLSRAAGFLARVAGGSCHPCEHWCPDETRVFATYVLARMGAAKPSYYGEFYAKRKQLPLFTQALLADAMFIGGGDRSRANNLLQEILNHAKESARGVHFEEAHHQTYATLWHSDVRTTGLVLQTLADIAPDHPYVSKIAHYLQSVRQADGKWRSTQEAAFSLMGLVELLRVKEKETPNFEATVLLGQRSLFEHGFRGRSMEVIKASLPMDQLAPAAAGPSKLVFKKEGAGALYYSALLRYAPKELPTKALDQGLFVQRWFEPYSGGGQATRFYAGDLIRVRLRVGTNQERHWAAFEVPLPAGIEPVDTSLATTTRLGQTPEDDKRELSYAAEGQGDQEAASAYDAEAIVREPWLHGFWSPFNHVEQRDSRVILFADHLPPGVHVASFVARATTPGTFVLKPARGELMYEPEVFGRSDGGTFEITWPPSVSEK
ncbi:MAG TPA: MG2 domain-containing protein [Myxococcaceae bacterium]|nr:MG2 domain-containing protein [Myxococcaceae bacterium]